MRPLLLAASFGVAACLLPGLQAQEGQEPQEAGDDAGFLEGLIQNALGGEGRTVTVRGLSGALSSEVTIELIEIADADGVWLRVRDAVLDWRRAALLRRRLNVDTLSVGELTFTRPPLPVPGEPPALQADEEATPFALPELPVAINVGEVAIGRLDLGEPVLGQAATLSLNGSAALADGEGAVNLDLVRLDGQEGRIGLDASFDNASRELATDLSVVEAEGGLLASLANIPGTPSLNLSVNGRGLISDFAADIRLATAGEERLSGAVTLSEERADAEAPPVRLIGANLQGDIAELFLPDYRAFFGRSVSLDFAARQAADTGFEVEALDLRTRGLTLAGRLAVEPTGAPRFVDLDGAIRTPSGLPVVLPLGGPPIVVSEAKLRVDFDAAAGDAFAAQIAADGILQADGFLVDSITLDVDGALTQGDGMQVEAAAADVVARLDGFSTTDPALWDAVGDAVDLGAAIDWQQAGDLRVSDLRLDASGLGATGDVTVAGLADGTPDITFDLSAVVEALSRFSALAGQALDGRVTAQTAGRYAVRSGAFDVALDGIAEDLSIGQSDADALLAGETTLAVSVARDAQGLRLDRLMLDGGAIELAGSAAISADGWPQAVDLAGRIGTSDGQPVILPLPDGELLLDAGTLDARYDAAEGDGFTLGAELNGLRQPGTVALDRATVSAEGRLERDGNAVSRLVADLDAASSAIDYPNDPGIAAALSEPVSLLAALDWDVDGVLSLSDAVLQSGALQITGALQAEGVAEGRPSVEGSLSFVSGPLARFAVLTGQDLSGTVDADLSGAWSAEGGDFQIDLDGSAADLAIGQETADQLLGGATDLVLVARREASVLSVEQFSLSNPELSARGGGEVEGGNGSFDVTASLRDASLLSSDLRGPVEVETGVVVQDDVWSVDGTLTGPLDTRIDVTGEVLRPDGTIDVQANGQSQLAVANGILTPRSIRGPIRFNIAVAGEPSPENVTGEIVIDGARFSDPGTRLTFEDIGVQVGLREATAQIDASAALSTGGGLALSGPVGLDAPFNGDLVLALNDMILVDPRFFEIAVGGQIDATGPLAGGAQIAGLIEIDRAEIKVPSIFGASGTMLDMVHVNEPDDSRQTRSRAGLLLDDLPPPPPEGGAGPSYPLDIVIDAPDEIFVRGRGLDAELGGSIEVRGTTNDPQPNGSLELIRGRLNILSRRLDFDEAAVFLQGDLVPDIRLVARSDSEGVTSAIVIEGSVDSPEISFTSDPELPEDEVLAQIFFGKPISDLTPFEAAQLVAAFNELRGTGGGLFGRVRQGLGVDNLDVRTDEDGNTEVSAGRYISERVYTDVSVGNQGTTEVQLNYDITPGFSATGSFDSEGNTGIGFTYQRDY